MKKMWKLKGQFCIFDFLLLFTVLLAKKFQFQ